MRRRHAFAIVPILLVPILSVPILLPALLLWAPLVTAQDLEDSFARDAIVIVGNGECYHFDVYLALTPEQQRRGLMHVRELPAFTGMLFVYSGPPGRHSMWMKNTLIPLDILFIREDGAISSIERRTEPLSLRSIESTEPVNYVLELNGGVTARLGIDGESRVLLPDALQPRMGRPL